jgi:hypothetical protein
MTSYYGNIFFSQFPYEEHLECLKYAHENGCSWGGLTCSYGAENEQQQYSAFDCINTHKTTQIIQQISRDP